MAYCTYCTYVLCSILRLGATSGGGVNFWGGVSTSGGGVNFWGGCQLNVNRAPYSAKFSRRIIFADWHRTSKIKFREILECRIKLMPAESLIRENSFQEIFENDNLKIECLENLELHVLWYSACTVDSKKRLQNHSKLSPTIYMTIYKSARS